MNRSFRATESNIYASLRQRPGSELGNRMKEKEEELALFLDMRKREQERNDSLIGNASEFVSFSGSNPGSSFSSVIGTSAPARRLRSDDFLNTDGEKNDYDWLLTPPGTPMFSSTEKEPRGSVTGQIGTLKVKTAELKSRAVCFPQTRVVAYYPFRKTNSAPRSNPISRQASLSPSLNTSTSSLRRHSSSASTSSTTSRPSTPTGRSSLPAATKPTRASTPTSRPTLPSAKPLTASAKPYTSGRSSTPITRPTLPSKPSSRPSTPTRSSLPSTVSNNPGPPARSTSVTKSRSTTSKVSMPATSKKPALETTKTLLASRGTSPTVRSRPWQPSQMPGFSLDAPPNLKTSMPERPVSASRGRPSAPSSLRSGVSEDKSNGRPRRQSCSPMGLRGRAPISGNLMGVRGRAPISGNLGNLEPSSSRLHSNGSESGDTVSPVVMGNKMVERVINMRRLAPPRKDEPLSLQSNPSTKPSPDISGFGRTLSKKSLDMALRHMDIRRSIPNSLKPIMTRVPASSLHSIRSIPVRSCTVSISDSPLATSSNASSERSVNMNFCLDVYEREDMGSEKGVFASPSESAHRNGNNGSEVWLHYPDTRENHS